MKYFMAALSIATLLVSFGCQSTKNQETSSLTAREVPANHTLRAEYLRLMVCKSVARKYYANPTDAQCLDKKYTITKRYFSGPEEKTLTMMDITTDAVFMNGVQTCKVVLKKDYSTVRVDDNGDLVGKPQWMAETKECEGLREVKLTDAEYKFFDKLMNDYAADATDWVDATDYCDTDTFESYGTVDDTVDLLEKSASGSYGVTCEDGSSHTVEFCSIEFDLDTNKKIDLDSVEVTYCDY